MRNQFNLKVISLIFSIIFSTHAMSAEKILPLPKPTPDKETITKTAKKKNIYPQKKPKLKEEKTELQESETITES